MKKLLIISILVIFLISAISATATYDYTTNWYYGSTAVNGVRAMNYECWDSGCYTLGTKLSDQTSSTNSITVSYPIPSGTYGYATYWFASCYAYQEMAWTPTGDGSYTQDSYFSKYSNCQGTINSVTASSSVNENQQLQISANIQSALYEAAAAPYGEPSDADIVQNFLSAQTDITLTITDSGGNTIHTETQQDYILRDSSGTYYFYWTPSYTQSGTYTIYVTTSVPDCKCTNDIDQQHSQSLTVNNVNRAPTSPTTVTLTPTTAYKGTQLTCSASGSTDDDGDAITYQYKFYTNPTLQDWSSTSTYTCGTNCDKGDTVYCDARAYDGTDYSSTITSSGVTIDNSAPTFDFALTDQTANEDQLFTYDINCTDVDGDNITYSDNTTLFIIDANGLISFTPIYSDVGTYNIQVNCSDINVTMTDNFTLTILSVNDAPNITGIPDQILQEDSGLNDNIIDLHNYTTDEDNTTAELTFTITSESNTTVVDCSVDSNQYIDCTTQTDQHGTSDVTVQVSDGSLTDTDIFTIEVNSTNDAPTFDFALIDQTATEDQLFTYDINCTDVDGDTIAYSDNTTLFTIDANGLISFTPDNDDVGNYNIEITCSDGNDSLKDSFTLTINNVNDAPTLDTVADQFVNEYTLLQFYLEGNDVDLGDTLTYSCNSTDLTVNKINNTVANVTWTPTDNDVGIHSVNCTLKDLGGAQASELFLIEVNNTNDAPIFNHSLTDQTATEDQLFTYDINCTDPQGDILTYSDNTSLFVIDSSTGLISFTPDNDDVGVYDIEIICSDSKEDVKDNFTLTINNVNDAPTFDYSLIDQTATEDQLFTYDINCTDVDGDTITYSDNTTLFAIDANGLISFTPTNSDVGIYDIEITCSDGTADAKDSFTLNIGNVNDAPTFDYSLIDQTATEDQLFTYDIDCTDVEGDTIAYSDNTSLFIIDSSTGLISFTPDNDDVGVYDIEITCSDGSDSSKDSFTLTINNVNDAPTFDPALTDQTATEDQLFTYDVNCTDVDAVTTITYSDNVSLFAIDSSTGLISFTPTNNDVGIYDIEITCSDGTADTKDSFTLTINNVNDAPVANNINTNTNEDTEVTITLDYTDADGDQASSCTVSNIVSGSETTACSCSSGTCTVGLTPVTDSTTTITADYIINDGTVDSNTATITVTINSINDAPEFDPALTDQTATEDQLFTYDIDCTDAEGDTITYSDNTTLFAIDANGLISFTPDNNNVGIHNIEVTCSDGTADTKDSFTLTINNVNDAPVANDVSASTSEDSSVSITLDCTDVDGDSLTYSIVSDPSHGSLSGSGDTRTYTPDANYNGADSFTYRCNDGTTNSNTATVSITISSVNDDPYFTSEPVTTFRQMNDKSPGDYTYDANAEDPEGTKLTYSLADAPSGMSINSETGMISWEPKTKGNYNVEVMVSDGTSNVIQFYTLGIQSPRKDSLSREKFYIGKIRTNNQAYDNIKAGDLLFVDLRFENIGRKNTKYATIRVTQPELGISRKMGPFRGPDVDDVMSQGTYLEIPKDAEPGVYTVRISLSDLSGIRRTRHRDFRIIE